jgi:hypothetical protein
MPKGIDHGNNGDTERYPDCEPGRHAYPYVEGIIWQGCPPLEEQNSGDNRAGAQKNEHVGAHQLGNTTLKKAYRIHDISSVTNG